MTLAARQTAALLVIVLSSAALYWASAEWVRWILMGLIGISMLVSLVREEGK